MLHTLAVITVVYENYTVLADFFESLAKQTNRDFHLFVIDLSTHKKPITAKHIPCTIIPSENKGYSYGVNLGLAAALDKNFVSFCVINNDTYFQQDFVDKALSSLKRNEGAIIAGKIYYASGFEYHKRRYKKDELGNVLWYAGGFVDWNHAMTPHRGVDEVDRGQYDRAGEVDFVNGALILFDKSVIEKVGFWDEDYFLYYEDADFSVRAKRAGVKLCFDPTLVIWHKNASSTGGSGSLLHRQYLGRNRLRFGLKYAPLRTKFHLLKNYILDQIRR